MRPHHVGVDERDSGRALHPPHRRLVVPPVHVPLVPPSRPRLDPSLLRIRDFLEPSELEDVGAKLARDVKEVVPPEELEAHLRSNPD